MVTEDYVSFESAKLLRAKGFEGDINAYYHIWDNGTRVCSVQEFSHSEAPHLYIPAPTLQMAMKWLREKHILVLPEPKSFTLDGEVATWVYNIWCDDNREVNADFFDGEPFEKYEDACEEAIKYCLKELI